MTIRLNPIKQRRVKVLFATFFCISFALVSCKKDETKIGKEVLSDDQILNSMVSDTFELTTYSFKEDSVNSKNQIHALLGAMNDPKFGTTNASFYTQVRLDNPGNTSFGIAPVVDSIVLSLGYAGYYGKTTTQTFEVYELTQDLNTTDKYYSFTTATYNPTNLVAPGKGTISPKPTTKVVVGTDTVGAQLRLPLVNSFASQLMDGVAAGHYLTQDAFKAFFKGFHLKVSNATPSANEGGVMYYALNNINTRLTIFYTVDGIQKRFSYLLDGANVNFNHLDFNTVGSRFQNVLDDSTAGQKEFYAQAFTSRAVIQIPTIKDLPANAIIHKANLILPVSYYSNDLIYPSAKISIGFRSTVGSNVIYSKVNTDVTFSSELKQYSINLREHIQDILIGREPNTGIFIRPTFFNSTTERIVFNGPQGIYKKKPKLVVTYTTY